MIRKSYAALRNLVTSLLNPNPDPNLNLNGQVESESVKTDSDLHHWLELGIIEVEVIEAGIK